VTDLQTGTLSYWRVAGPRAAVIGAVVDIRLFIAY
jgi:hypothetical protein